MGARKGSTHSALIKAEDIGAGIGTARKADSVPDRFGRRARSSKYKPLIDSYDKLNIDQCFVFEPPSGTSEKSLKTLRLVIHNALKKHYDGFKDTEHRCRVTLTEDGQSLKIACVENE